MGVTLVDRKAGVGGIAHLLLPSGNGSIESERPAVFADHGLPILIERLVNLGATMESLEACVAGGGLVGRLTERDLSFDPGGRTTEVVRRFLADAGIPVRQFDTGGYLGRRMDFFLEDLQTTINPVVESLGRDITFTAKPGEEEIRIAVGQVRPIPQIALTIIRLLNRGLYNWNQIRDEVRKDQVIGARVLHLANSALAGLSQKVETIDRALLLLGEHHLFQIVVAAACEDYFLQNDKGYSLCRGGMYLHAVRTAVLAERIAVKTSACPPDLAYTGGLLHDIGKVVLDRFVAKIQPLFYRLIEERGAPLVDVEKETLGMTHPEAGEALARAWDLPPYLREVIRWHHEPGRAVLNPGLTSMVFLADLIMSRYHTGLDLEYLDGAGLAGALRKIGLKRSDFPALIRMSMDLPA